MKFFKVRYQIGPHGEYIYPPGVAKVVWRSAYYHYTEKVMIGETDRQLAADGDAVIELEKAEALAEIDEFQKSVPTPPEEPPTGSASSAREPGPPQIRNGLSRRPDA